MVVVFKINEVAGLEKQGNEMTIGIPKGAIRLAGASNSLRLSSDMQNKGANILEEDSQV